MSSLLDNLMLGFQTSLSLSNIGFCFVGCLLGTLIGVLPGLGPAATIAMLLPITFTLDPSAALIMLAGIYYGAQYGGSTTAILINLPGEATSVVTAIDGYQMARNGFAGKALAAAAIGSFVAGSIATLAIAAFGPLLSAVSLSFGPAEYCALMALGLVVSSVLAQGPLLRAFAMVIVGMLIGTVGIDVTSGYPRFSFGITELSDGLNIVAVAMGLFGLAEIMRNLGDFQRRELMATKLKGLFPSREDLRAITAPVLRGSFIGTVIGVLPGGGALLSSFMAYAAEKRFAKDPSRFGKGAIEGVAAPEAANNAGAQTSFIPLLTLGIPSTAIMALMAGAMIIQGIRPGPGIVHEQPQLFWGLVTSMWVGNLILLVLNLPLVGLWARLTTVKYDYLSLGIIAFCCIGVYTINGLPSDLLVMVVFGALGVIFIELECELTPLILGIILGPMFEEYLRRAMLLSQGDPSVFVTRPISAVLLMMCVIAILLVTLPNFRKIRKEALQEE